jgi:hydroxymethylpyrimidine/phosphomethylpyrimidine kinase
MLERLFPRVTIVTPNVPEAAALLNEEPATGEDALIRQAQRLLALGPQVVLLKGGHSEGEEAVDLLVTGHGIVHRIVSARVRATSRGTGCALASAIAAGLASGASLLAACQQAKRYVVDMLRQAD